MYAHVKTLHDILQESMQAFWMTFGGGLGSRIYDFALGKQEYT